MGEGTKHVDPPSTQVEACSPHSSSSSSSNLNRQVSAPCRNEDFGSIGFFSPSVFGHVPTVSEVEFAISFLKHLIQALSGSNWLVRMLEGPAATILVSSGLMRVYDAFQLLEIDPSVKRLVVALATDKNLWNAILRNELVQKLIERPCSAENGSRLRPIEEPELAATVLQWIWEMSKAKVMELVEKFQALMNEIFQRREMEKGNNVQRREMEKGNNVPKNEDQLEEKVRSSLLLTVIILLIVVIARANGL